MWGQMGQGESSSSLPPEVGISFPSLICEGQRAAGRVGARLNEGLRAASYLGTLPTPAVPGKGRSPSVLLAHREIFSRPLEIEANRTMWRVQEAMYFGVKDSLCWGYYIFLPHFWC